MTVLIALASILILYIVPWLVTRNANRGFRRMGFYLQSTSSRVAPRGKATPRTTPSSSVRNHEK